MKGGGSSGVGRGLRNEDFLMDGRGERIQMVEWGLVGDRERVMPIVMSTLFNRNGERFQESTVYCRTA